MLNRLVSSLGFVLSGLVGLVFAVYLTSFWLRPADSAVSEDILAQNTDTPSETMGVEAADTGVSGTEGSGQKLSDSVKDIDAGSALLEPYLYDTREGRRNPFKPTTLVTPGVYSDQILGPATPLERYELDELKLLGILWDVKSPRAMFLDPNNEVHTVAKDDRIGRRRGYVAVIREGEVVVVETTTFGGESVYSTRVLRIDR